MVSGVAYVSQQCRKNKMKTWSVRGRARRREVNSTEGLVGFILCKSVSNEY